MNGSMRHFLVAFFVMVASGASLILLIPGTFQESGGAPVWVLAVLGGIAAASALYAQRFRPHSDV